MSGFGAVTNATGEVSGKVGRRTNRDELFKYVEVSREEHLKECNLIAAKSHAWPFFRGPVLSWPRSFEFSQSCNLNSANFQNVGIAVPLFFK